MKNICQNSYAELKVKPFRISLKVTSLIRSYNTSGNFKISSPFEFRNLCTTWNGPFDMTHIIYRPNFLIALKTIYSLRLEI